jgi:hypothetical protein
MSLLMSAARELVVVSRTLWLQHIPSTHWEAIWENLNPEVVHHLCFVSDAHNMNRGLSSQLLRCPVRELTLVGLAPDNQSLATLCVPAAVRRLTLVFSPATRWSAEPLRSAEEEESDMTPIAAVFGQRLQASVFGSSTPQPAASASQPVSLGPFVFQSPVSFGARASQSSFAFGVSTLQPAASLATFGTSAPQPAASFGTSAPQPPIAIGATGPQPVGSPISFGTSVPQPLASFGTSAPPPPVPQPFITYGVSASLAGSAWFGAPASHPQLIAAGDSDEDQDDQDDQEPACDALPSFDVTETGVVFSIRKRERQSRYAELSAEQWGGPDASAAQTVVELVAAAAAAVGPVADYVPGTLTAPESQATLPESPATWADVPAAAAMPTPAVPAKIAAPTLPAATPRAITQQPPVAAAAAAATLVPDRSVSVHSLVELVRRLQSVEVLTLGRMPTEYFQLATQLLAVSAPHTTVRVAAVPSEFEQYLGENVWSS